MLLTVFCLRRDRSELTFSLQVDADFELQNFRALCELESGIPAAESQIVYAEVPLTDNHRSLASYGLKDGDVVLLQQVENAEKLPAAAFPGLPRIDFSSITVPGTSAQTAPMPPQQPGPPSRASPPEVPPAPPGLDNPGLLRDMLLSNPHELSLLKERNPPLAEALLSGDLEKFTQVLVEQQQDRARREQERLRLFSADPFDLEAQAKIEEDIRQQNIEENMTIAMEEAPESFGQVVMLYINCKVNGHPVKAFVDSGAQMTIMSQACAERCNIMRLVDRRWAGIAKGVGTQKIIGRVHLAQVQIEGDFLPCSFSILEEQPMDMLLGLDMLKRHQCSIDLKKNVLVIGTTGSQTTFLPEGELPECARLAYGAGREDVRPEEIADHELAEAIQKSVEEAEITGKETTSPEQSLLPSSDGFQHPVHFPEVALKTRKSFRRPLDRSASAPTLCSHKCSLAQTVNPTAAKSVESLPECPAALGREGLLDLSDGETFTRVDASRAATEPCRHTNSPSPNTCAKLVTPGTPTPSCAKGSGPGLASPLEEAGGSRDAPAGDVAGLPPSSLLKLSQMGPSPHEELGPEQSPDETTRSQDDLSAKGESPSPAPGGQAMGHVLPEGWKFSSEGTQRPESAPHRLPGDETVMEVEVTDQVLISAESRLKEQRFGSSAVNSECSMMEAQSSQPDSSLSADPLSGRAAVESADVAATAGCSGSPPPPPEGQVGPQAEGACPSLTSALKELHQLLVASYKTASWPQSLDQPRTFPEEDAAFQEEHGCGRDIRDVELSSPEGVPAYPGAEASAGEGLSGAGAEALEPADALLIQEPLGWDSSIVRRSSAASHPPPCGECTEMLSPCLSPDHAAGDQAVEQTPSDLTRGPGSWRVLDFPPGEPGVPVSSDAAEPAAPHICPPEIGSAPSRPPLFSSVDIAQITRAGFTPQEASEALEQAGGNVDLALLILLAKNIVVPT